MRSIYFIWLTISLCVLISCEKSEKIRADQDAQADVAGSEEPVQDLSPSVSTEMVFVPAGEYTPLYGKDSVKVQAGNLLVDVYPVTNKQYLEFVRKNRRWRKSQLKSIYGDKNYLIQWTNDTTLSPLNDPDAPVTNVSWFTAKAYCDCLDKRLPTVDEWEYLAMADAQTTDARKNKSYNQYILNWYETPKTYTNKVGSTFRNYYGIYDLHGLVWEWTMDFSSVMISGESRKDVTTDRQLFCGSGSEGANDLMNYAAFMRYAFRGSLDARYAVQNLGFRCVKDTTIRK